MRIGSHALKRHTSNETHLLLLCMSTTINSSVTRIYYHSAIASIAQSSVYSHHPVIDLLLRLPSRFRSLLSTTTTVNFSPNNIQFKEYIEMLLCVRWFSFFLFLLISSLFSVNADQLLILFMLTFPSVWMLSLIQNIQSLYVYTRDLERRRMCKQTKDSKDESQVT